jgi:hypothetical protein
MFAEYIKDLQEVKDAFLDLRYGDALRANIAFQQKLLDLYDQLMSDKPMSLQMNEAQAKEFELQLRINEEELELQRGKVGISSLELLAILKAGIDFGKMVLDIWRNRNKPE